MNPVPVFIPPLATLLAKAELSANRALTATEVEAIRDQAVCLMKSADERDLLTEARGFRDVDAADWWADWHRLRVQLTGRGYRPKIVLCVPGDDAMADTALQHTTDQHLECELSSNHPRMARAFRIANATLSEEELEEISEHTRVAYVLSPNFNADDAEAMARRLLETGAFLLEHGGLGIKQESSGVAHPRATWLTIAASARNGSRSALLSAYVNFNVQREDEFSTCGMHLLGRPDLIVAKSQLPEGFAVEPLFRAFAAYVMEECGPAKTLRSGDTFRAEPQSPCWRLLWEPCTSYAEDDFSFNCFGRYRFLPADSP